MQNGSRTDAIEQRLEDLERWRAEVDSRIQAAAAALQGGLPHRGGGVSDTDLTRQTVSVGEAARVLGVNHNIIYDMAHTTGQIADGVPILKISGRYQIPRARLLAYANGDLNPDPPKVMGRLSLTSCSG